MVRRMVSIFCALCAIVCITAIVSLARSFISAESIRFEHGFADWTLAAGDGVVSYSSTDRTFRTARAEERWKTQRDPARTRDFNEWALTVRSDQESIDTAGDDLMGFGADRYEGPSRGRFGESMMTIKHRVVTVPHWAMILTFGGWPALRYTRASRLRQSRAARGLCRRCGFSLGTVYHCCPECGMRAPLPPHEMLAELA